jgi:cold shock CspA family protein
MPSHPPEFDDFGTVTSWDRHRGYGFVRGDRGKDIFVGRSELLAGGIQNLQVGMRLASASAVCNPCWPGLGCAVCLLKILKGRNV